MTPSARISCLLLAVSSFLLKAQTPPSSTAKLQYIAVLSRHGIRSPLWTAEQLNAYSADPWPDWDVPVGSLTRQGGELMKLMGVYDREYLSRAGLLGSSGCDDASRFHFWSDTSPRDIDTGKAIAAGMFPGCTVVVHSVAPAKTDPLFNPLGAGIGKPDPDLAAAAISGRIGGHPQSLVDTYRAGLEAMQQILLGCEPGKKCPPEGKSVKKLLLEQPSVVEKTAHLAKLSGPLEAASTLAESLLLEYTDGKKDKDVGWGRLNQAALRSLLLLQDAYVDLELRTPYIARASGSNLLSHMLKSMQQAVRGKPVEGAMGKPGDKGVIVLGHDSDLSYFGGLLRISWLLEGYQRDSRPPGAALVFELWSDTATGKRTVRTYIMSQTLDQMRNATPLSVQTPPSRAPIFVPGCSTAAEGWPCDWDTFQRAVSSAIDPAFVR